MRERRTIETVVTNAAATFEQNGSRRDVHSSAVVVTSRPFDDDVNSMKSVGGHIDGAEVLYDARATYMETPINLSTTGRCDVRSSRLVTQRASRLRRRLHPVPGVPIGLAARAEPDPIGPRRPGRPAGVAPPRWSVLSFGPAHNRAETTDVYFLCELTREVEPP